MDKWAIPQILGLVQKHLMPTDSEILDSDPIKKAF